MFKIIFIFIAIWLWSELVDILARLAMLDNEEAFKDYIDKMMFYIEFGKSNFSGWRWLLSCYVEYRIIAMKKIAKMTKFK